ncbi:ferritin family protein [Thermococcus stetteri]|uniref:ferritin family protein n=1 Tax=Thermococcus stetteri TaxID=49900 RepID=UPI001AE589C9|nr:ferritin family protein [Thermococcus stetteri]MBP1911256.1 rubrerythrin [Thermococcus stetteri]
MLKNLNGYELLSYAICNEECAAEIYEWLSERLEGEASEEFRRLAAEKKKHALRMRELFSKLYPNREPIKFNAPPLDVLPVCSEMMKAKSEEEALSLALLSEALGKTLYMKLARMVGDEKIRLLFEELAGIKEETYKHLLEVYEFLSSGS